MRTSTAFLFSTFVLTGASLFAADTDPKAGVADATKKLADLASYAWKTTTRNQGGGAFGGNSSVRGKAEKGGYTWVSSSSPQPTLEFARKEGKAAVLLEDTWMTLDQASARRASGSRNAGPFGGGFNEPAITDFKLPTAQVQELLTRLTNFKREGEVVTADLPAERVSELMNPAGGRGGRGGARGGFGGPLQDPKGTVIFQLKDGLLAEYIVTLSGTREIRGNTDQISRTTTTIFSDIGTTKIALAADAKEIVDTLVAGGTPNVFVPEPGFKKLFNGHDLAGWAG
ncbi:MAG TPA: hypothetical protein VGR78_16000, partial [Verrucomicrobiae bacterium]|nr:hypothetical protein [Verrucomicrobiae bacterium]